LVEELIDTEQRITTTLNVEEFIAQKSRSKRLGRKKRRRRELATRNVQTIRAQLRLLGRSMLTYRQQERGGEISEDSAAEEEEPGPSNKETRRAKNARLGAAEREMQEVNELFAKAHEEMDSMQKLFACCEAMVCYGFQNEAQLVAEKLATEMFNKPPKLLLDPSNNTNESQKFYSGKRHKYPIVDQESKTVASSPYFLQNQRRSIPFLAPPSREALNTAKKIIMNLKRTLFVLKCLLKGVPICPVSTMKAYDYENETFKFKKHSVALKLGISTLLNPRCPAPTKQLEVQIVILVRRKILLSCLKITSSEIHCL
jgi:hypothetical protein